MADFTFQIGDRTLLNTVGSPVPNINVWKINGQIIPEATGPSFEYVFNVPGLYVITHQGKASVECNFTSIDKTIEILALMCYWVYTKGGISSINIPNIFELIDAYLLLRNIGFVPTVPQIFASIDYYIGLITVTQFNTTTSCTF